MKKFTAEQRQLIAEFIKVFAEVIGLTEDMDKHEKRIIMARAKQLVLKNKVLIELVRSPR